MPQDIEDAINSDALEPKIAEGDGIKVEKPIRCMLEAVLA